VCASFAQLEVSYHIKLPSSQPNGGVAQNIQVKLSSGLEGGVLPYGTRKRSKTTENGNKTTTPQRTNTTVRSPEEAQTKTKASDRRKTLTERIFVTLDLLERSSNVSFLLRSTFSPSLGLLKLPYGLSFSLALRFCCAWRPSEMRFQ
jgi:hypothetical protein